MRSSLLLIALVVPSTSFAAELADPTAALALSDKAMKLAASGKVRAALEELRPYVVIPQSEFDSTLGQAELQLPVIASRFGKPIGYELVRNDTVGASLVQAIYLQKFERHAMVWRFIYYKNDKGWVLNSFKFSDDLGTVL
jgi:hypothetical protein